MTTGTTYTPLQITNILNKGRFRVLDDTGVHLIGRRFICLSNVLTEYEVSLLLTSQNEFTVVLSDYK